MHLKSLSRPIIKAFVWMTAKLHRVIVAYLITRLLAVFVFGAIEGWAWHEGVWWGEVASLTIGYGDIAPKTFAGRLLATPFHFFWVYYCGLAIAGHIVLAVFKSRNEMTHEEQEWLFHVVTVVFDWVRWIIQVILHQLPGITDAVPLPHLTKDGDPIECPPQAADTEDGDLAPALTKSG